MKPVKDFWYTLRALHLLGAIVWVGGLFFLLVIMRPAMSELTPAQRVDVYRAAFHRFLRMLWIVMPAMLVTGYGMMFGQFGGIWGASWSLELQHLLGLAMSAIFVFLWFGPYQPFQQGRGRSIEAIRPLLEASLVLGLATTIVAVLV